MAHQQTIKPGSGYWDITQYPIGGCFRRASRALVVTDVESLDRPYRGVTHTGLAEGTRIAFSAAALETVSVERASEHAPQEPS